MYDASGGVSDRVMFARDRRALQSRTDGPVNMVKAEVHRLKNTSG